MKNFTAILTLLASTTFAQQQYQIDPNSVSNGTKQGWCSSQQSQCPLICLQTSAASAQTESNTCDPASLTYSCVCSNGQSPNVSEYSQTLPYYICQQWGLQCQNNCNGDSTCQADCTQNHPCGAQNPKRVNITTMSSSTISGSATGSGASSTAFQTGFAGGQASASASSAANSMVTSTWANKFGHTLGGMAVFSGILFGFAVML